MFVLAAVRSRFSYQSHAGGVVVSKGAPFSVVVDGEKDRERIIRDSISAGKARKSSAGNKAIFGCDDARSIIDNNLDDKTPRHHFTLTLMGTDTKEWLLSLHST